MKNKICLIALSVALIFNTKDSQAQKLRITCVNLFATETTDEDKAPYSVQLQKLLGDKYQVSNCLVKGSFFVEKVGNSYRQSVHKKALTSRPDIVFVETNVNRKTIYSKSAINKFKTGYLKLVKSFEQLPSHPRVILLLPFRSFKRDTDVFLDSAIKTSIIPVIQQVAYKEGFELINLSTLLVDDPRLSMPEINPSKSDAEIIAGRLYQLIKQERDMSFNISKTLAIPVQLSSFYGYTCSDFIFKGRNCKVVSPKFTSKGHQWVWRARFWGHEPQADIAMLENGFHIVYCDVIELYGNQEAVMLWNNFYELMLKNGLSKKAAMEGMSRGGVYVYNWAAENPEKVACVYVDNPVLDLKSWPGAKGKGPGSKDDWEKVKYDYDLTTPQAELDFASSPINKIAQIVNGGYPMLHLLADADEVVPPDENTLPFEQKVKKLGGNITVLHKPGFKHHPHSLPNPSFIVNFFLRYTMTDRSW